MQILSMSNLQLYMFSKNSLYRLSFFCYFILISVLSLTAGEKNTAFDLNSYGILYLDKMSHTLAYALFSIQGFIQLKDRRRYKPLCIAIALYGTLLEFIQQAFIPQRMGSIEDGLANIFGVVIGYIMCTYWVDRKKKVG